MRLYAAISLLIVFAAASVCVLPVSAFFVGWSVGQNCGGEGNVTAGSTNFLTCSSTISVTAGDLIVATTANNQTKTLIVKDSSNNVYTQQATVTGGRPSTFNLLTAVASATNAALTVKTQDSAAAALTGISLTAANFTWSGGGLTGNVDACNTAAASNNSVSVTATATTDLLYGVGEGSTSISAGTGFTADNTPPAGCCRLLGEHATSLVSVIGSNTVSYTSGGPHGIIGCAILAGTTAGSSSTRRVRWYGQ